jgi:hypothetical protein
MVMSKTKVARLQIPAPKSAGVVVGYDPSLKPALASIRAACHYMGDIGRAKFYADILPLLETVKLGSRNLVVVSSMDRLIEANRRRVP